MTQIHSAENKIHSAKNQRSYDRDKKWRCVKYLLLCHLSYYFATLGGKVVNLKGQDSALDFSEYTDRTTTRSTRACSGTPGEHDRGAFDDSGGPKKIDDSEERGIYYLM